MIDKEVFAQRMGLLTARIGRELDPPVFAEYYRELSPALTSEQFIAATALVFRTWNAEYRNWPSPQQLIESIVPVAQPTLSALEAFEAVLAAMHPHKSHPEQIIAIQTLGAAALRAFRASGGFREFSGATEDAIPWLRKRFVEAYTAACQNADAEQAAKLALASADSRFQELVAKTSAALPAMPDVNESRKRLTEKAS